MKTVSLTIDGQQISAREGESLLWAALDNGIYVPNLCSFRQDDEPTAACRLCFVRVDDSETPVTACTETVREGLTVDTRSTRALDLVRSGFALLMASHPVDCGHCGRNHSCDLQRIARHLRVSLKPRRLRRLTHNLQMDSSHASIVYDPNKCVLCGKCVRVCRLRGEAGALGFAHRGFERRVTTFGDLPLGDSLCGQCTACAEVCPTGALLLKGEPVTATAGAD